MPCSPDNPLLRAKFHTRRVIDWTTLEPLLAQKEEARARPAAYLAERLGVRVQAVTNWKTRGIPVKHASDIARLIGWPVDRVLGREAQQLPAWPFRRLSADEWHSLDDFDRALIEDAALRRMRELQAERISRTSGKPQRRTA